ncbi:MAG: esterase-like activity of phytase family protein [Myxococcaceae bacterium]|nr:esterase-like activity of phytase family protein [Myxococcaceae bacterium]
MLVQRAIMPADTFAPGPPSGRVLKREELRGRKSPFASQPVQGFSSLLLDVDGDGGYLALSDNGYGAPENSADYRLRIYRVRLEGPKLTWQSFIELSDPNHHAPFPIVHELTDAGRPLTGADFDPESMQRLADGTFWLGDELGPYLLHVDAEGRLLEPPYAVPGVSAPQTPALRAMNVLAAHAQAHGAPVPIASPKHTLIPEVFDPRELKKAGFDVIPWTVNEPARAEALTALGVAGIISDRPDRIAGAQGHRGARGLRPESTLPAFEVALELGVVTLEADLQLTRDGVAVVGHDPELDPTKCRVAKPVRLAALTAAEAQRIICDKLLPAYPDQVATAGPKATAFAKAEKLASPFALVTLDQLLRFAKDRADVRFNLEIKTDPETLTDAAVAVIRKHGLAARVDLQSFDHRALLHAHRTAPELRTVALFEDGWLTVRPTVQRSSGFEALALGPDGALYAMLEKPLEREHHAVRVYRFDLASKVFTRAFDYPLHPRALAAPDLQYARGQYVVLERDDTEGDPSGFKRVFTFEPDAGTKRELVDLEALPNLTYPFWTIESALPLPNGRLAVVNDNNYPYSCGRHVDAGEPDDTELVVIEP